MKNDPALEAYFKEAASWDADRQAMDARTIKIAWGIAIGACVLTVVAIAALMLLTPLKRVEPFLIRVDNTTGVVDVVPMYTATAELPETLTRHFLGHYIAVCERFNFPMARSDYDECAAFNAPARNSEWGALWDRTNPLSPLNLYKDGSIVQAQASSMRFFKSPSGADDMVQVRFTKTRRIPNGGAEKISHWISTIQYAVVGPSQDPGTRSFNPLGLKVVEYRSEPEIAAAPEPSTPTAAAELPAGGAP